VTISSGADSHLYSKVHIIHVKFKQWGDYIPNESIIELMKIDLAYFNYRNRCCVDY